MQEKKSSGERFELFQDPKLVIIAALIITVIILSVLLLTKKPETKIIRQVATPPPNSNQRGEESPYIKNEVRNTIAKKWKELNACYTEFLNADPKPEVTEGQIKVDWQVESDGKVISPEVVTSEINHPVLEQCLIARVQKWKFPPPPPNGQNTYIVYKFFFKKVD